MCKKHSIFKYTLLQNLIESSDNNPTEFGKIVNLLKEKNCEGPSQNISPQEWYDYFNTLMNLKYDNNFNVTNICKYVDSNSDELNADITAEEVIKAVKSLKIKKSCGFDCITNEMIKVSCSIHVQIYTDIFNVILKFGIYPSLWRENFIKPLFKGGCSNDPSCYRGIAISSCLSKFFIRIHVLYNRLDKYLEKNNIICPEQIGFRKGCRTSDHVFTLKTLIDKFCKKNKYLFACFVDLKKAFDTVNRQALLYKLSKYNIDGRF